MIAFGEVPMRKLDADPTIWTYHDRNRSRVDEIGFYHRDPRPKGRTGD